MFCLNCGKENANDARFCARCGNPLPVLQNVPLTEPPGINPNPGKPSKKGKGKKKWIFIGAGAAAVIAAAIIILIWVFPSGNANADDYEAAAEEYVSVSEEITELTQDDEYINSDTAQKSELMQELLLQLADAGLLAEDEIYYDEDSQIIWYEYATGGIGAVMLQEHAEDTEGAADGDGYVTEYTEEGLVGSIKDVVEIDVDGCPYEEEDLSALIIYDLGFDQIKEYLNDAATLYWPSEYLSTYMLEGASVEILRTLFSGYDLIMIREHGIINEDGQICIELSQESSFLTRLLYAAEISITESDQAYIDDIQTERICILYTSSGENKFCLMPDFFTYYYGDGGLDDAIVWLGCCNGYMDDSLVGAIAGCGAKAVIGPTESVNTYYGTYMQLAFVYMLMYGNTVEDSLDFAKSVWGENDSVYVSNYNTNSVDDTPAEFRIYNGGDEVLVTLTQEAIDALSGTKITDKTSLYQAYYDKLLEYEALWGTSDRSYDEESSYVQLEGLCFAHLIDMDGDGEEELLLGYQDSYISDYEIGLEFWADVDGELTLVSSPDLASLDGGSFLFNMITELDGTYYIVNGDLGNGGGGTFYLYSYSDGKLSLSKTLVAGGEGECSIDGESVSVDEAWELADEIYNNAQYYYFYEFTYYSDPTDFAMADDELEVTLKILMDYLGIGSSSSASGSSDDWAETYLDFLEEEVTISEYTWLYYSETYSYEYFEGNPYDYVGFGLIYVNDDDIPELVMYGTSEATGMLIFTIDEDGEIDVIMSERTNSFYYAKKGNLLVNSAGVSGWSFDYIYTIEDGKWVQLARGDYEYYDADEDGTLEYYWNDEEVTEEEYEENLSSYEAGLSMTYPESDPEYDLSELKEYLNAQ